MKNLDERPRPGRTVLTLLVLNETDSSEIFPKLILSHYWLAYVEICHTKKLEIYIDLIIEIICFIPHDEVLCLKIFKQIYYFPRDLTSYKIIHSTYLYCSVLQAILCLNNLINGLTGTDYHSFSACFSSISITST